MAVIDFNLLILVRFFFNPITNIVVGFPIGGLNFQAAVRVGFFTKREEIDHLLLSTRPT